MEIVAVLLIMLVLAAVLYVVSAPLRKGHEALETKSAARRAELEAAKEAKYREIRDAEMDFQTGKLDAPDHKVLDRQLRAEAMEILHALDAEGLVELDAAEALAGDDPAAVEAISAPEKVARARKAPAAKAAAGAASDAKAPADAGAKAPAAKAPADAGANAPVAKARADAGATASDAKAPADAGGKANARAKVVATAAQAPAADKPARGAGSAPKRKPARPPASPKTAARKKPPAGR